MSDKILKREEFLRIASAADARKGHRLSPVQVFDLLRKTEEQLVTAGATRAQIAQWAIGMVKAVARDAELTEEQRNATIAMVEDALNFDITRVPASDNTKPAQFEAKPRRLQ